MKELYKTLAAAAVCAAWAVWLSSAYLAHGPHSYYRQHDTAEANGAFYAGQAAYAERDLLGSWTPSAGAGVDARANGKGVQPLFEGIFRVLPYWWTPGLIALLSIFTASFFTYVLLRRRLGIAWVPAVLAGLPFSMMYDGAGAHSGFFLGAGLFLPLFPLMLYGLMRAGELPGPWPIGAAAAIGIVISVSAPPLLIVLAIPVVAWWMLAVERGIGFRRLAVLATFAIVSVLMALPLLAALATHAADAHRLLLPSVDAGAGADAATWAMRREEAERWIRITLPMAAPALAGWLLGGFMRRSLNALVVISAAILALAWGMPAVRAALERTLPALATFQFDLLTQFLPFVTAAAGAVGLHQILSLHGGRRPWLRIAGAVVVGAAVCAVAYVVIGRGVVINAQREEMRRYPTNYAGLLAQPALASLAAKMRGEAPARIVTFADRNQGTVGQHPGFAWAHGLETADGYLNLYPIRYHTFWSWLIKPALDMNAEVQTYFGEWGNRFYLFNPYVQLPNPLPISQIANPNLLALANVRYVVSGVALSGSHLALRGGDDGTPSGEVMWVDAPANAKVRKLFVYENTAWLPRAFVATRTRTFDRSDAMLSAMSSATLDELRTTAFLEAEDDEVALPEDAPSAVAPADVRLTTYTADAIELEVRTLSPGMLVITNTYDPGWTVRVNDTPATLRRVDFTFQGLPVATGTSRVRLEYAPPYARGAWETAGASALVALVLMGLWVFASRVTSHRGVPRSAIAIGLPVAAIALLGAAFVFTRSRAEGVSETPWAEADATHRVRLFVRARSVSTPSKVPVLVQRGPDDAAFWASPARDAREIRFVDADGQPLSHEIEEYDPAARRLAAWVAVPRFGWGDRAIHMYWGGATAGSGQPADIWGGQYEAVWHMSPQRGAGVVRDSSGHGLDAAASEGLTMRWATRGRIGGAVMLKGADKLTVADSPAWTFGADDWSVEFWINPAPMAGRNYGIIEHGPGGVFQLYLHGSNMFALERNNAGVYGDHSFAGLGVPTGEWSHVSIARMGRRLILHVNGEMKSTVEQKDGFADGESPHPLTLGWGTYGGVDGALDEMRVARGPRPPGWSRATYLAQTGRTVTFGSVESRPAGKQ